MDLLVGVLEGPIVIGCWDGMVRDGDGRGGVLMS